MARIKREGEKREREREGDREREKEREGERGEREGERGRERWEGEKREREDRRASCLVGHLKDISVILRATPHSLPKCPLIYKSCHPQSGRKRSEAI